LAARRNARTVEMQDFEKAKDKIIMGPERKSMVMPEEERRNTAYHESGHAVVGKLLPKAIRCTRSPSCRAACAGRDLQLPEKDRYSYDKDKMLNQIAILFGGRIAEEVFMNQMTTGASNDFERATKMARDMVTRYGMSDAGHHGVCRDRASLPGPHVPRPSPKPPAEGGRGNPPHPRRAIRAGAQAAGRQPRQGARHGQGLLEWETIDADQINDIMAGKEPRPPRTGASQEVVLDNNRSGDVSPNATAAWPEARSVRR
jgi:cell division protease FtsH